MMHTDQRAAVERVREKAGRKGVDLGFGWVEWSDWSDCWWDNHTDRQVSNPSAALIITGALAKWLAGQGIAVYAKLAGGLLHRWVSMRPGNPTYSGPVDLGPDATDHLSALLAATNARLDELPDSPPPASKEGE